MGSVTMAEKNLVSIFRRANKPIVRMPDISIKPPALVIKNVSDLRTFEISSEPRHIIAMALTDTEKSHPFVVLNDGSLLITADPTDVDNSLIRAQRILMLENNNGRPAKERLVERAVLRSWISTSISQAKQRSGIQTNKDCESILYRAAMLNATDIHIDISPGQGSISTCTIRYRANGVFCESASFDGDTGLAINAAFWETYVKDGIAGDLVKDGRFSRMIDGQEFLFRLSYGASPTLGIVTTAIRARNMHDIPDVNALGYSARQKTLIKESQGRAGVVLIAGSVNSGKSTLQSAWMAALPADQFNLEVSDQVEVILPNFTQLQKPSSGSKEVIREQTQLLYKLPTRHDIDFIAINEVRDRDTAQLMQDLMQLGTPGITSIHAKGWPEAINRLRSDKMGVDAETLFSEGFFNAICYQTLGRVLCDCKLDAHTDKFWDDYFRKRLGDTLAFRNAKGCDACGRTGIAGLTAVAEFIPIVDSNRRLLRDTTNSTAMYQWMHSNNIETIFEHALSKIKALQLDPQMIRLKLGDFNANNIFDQYRGS
tara:strand:- start:534 stop:2159 length:1626 start_codon:yes stop_codon:yes gene_type:complete